jgi:asparagine N-glycosylation enzyme membrane subunit Stt3
MKKKAIYFLATAIFFVFTGLAWEGAILLPIIILLFTGIYSIYLLSKTQQKEAKETIIYSIGTISLATLLLYFFGTNILLILQKQFKINSELNFFPIFFIGIISIAIIFALSFKKISNNAKTKLWHLTFIGVFGLALLTVISLVFSLFTNKITLIQELNSGINAILSVFGTTLVFPILFILIFLMRMFYTKKIDVNKLLFFICLTISLSLAFFAIKYFFLLALFIPFSTAIIFLELASEKKDFPKNKNIFSKKNWELKHFFIIFVIIIFITLPFTQLKQNPTLFERNSGLEESLFWMKDQLPKNSKIMNWWDYGHAITFVSNMKVSNDNLNYSSLEQNPNIEFAKFLIEKDTNKSFFMLKKVNPDYLFLEIKLIDSFNNFFYYANEGENRGAYIIPCKENEKTTDIICDYFIFDANFFTTLPTQWVDKPSLGKGYAYRHENNIIVFDNTANNSTLMKLWFKEESTLRKYEEVFSNHGVKIFRVK